jgi:hypothetical protein
MAHSPQHVTNEELNTLIEAASKESSLTLRNALCELKGLRAVHALCNPSIFVTVDGRKMVVR